MRDSHTVFIIWPFHEGSNLYTPRCMASGQTNCLIMCRINYHIMCILDNIVIIESRFKCRSAPQQACPTDFVIMVVPSVADMVETVL